jgi:hypothetical protein
MKAQLTSSHEPKYKTCSMCKVNKLVNEFNFRNTAARAYHSYCKECGKQLTRLHYRNNKRQYLERNLRSYAKRRALVINAKSQPCADCGVQYPYYVMDLDHREGVQKNFSLHSVQGATKEAVLREIEKCDVVCSNCHRVRTYNRRIKRTVKDETLS